MMNIGEISNSKKCFGCCLCGDICPETAIVFSEDDEGFSFPAIEAEKCTDCGLCYKFCPVVNDFSTKNERDPKTLAVWHRDKSVVNNSTSGGAFTVLAEDILADGGAVYGAQFDENFFLHHSRAEQYSQLEPMRGSKYLQSSCLGVFQRIRNDLNSEKRVLFVGTPCQVAAVDSFFRNHDNNKLLLLVDIVCHGVNSPGVFRQYKTYLENKYKDKMVGYSFRGKKNGWSLPQVVINFTSKTITTIFDVDPFIAGFRKNIYLRLCCHECKFATMPRVGDITIGDFWGVPKEFYNKEGVSLLLVNNQKGAAIVENNKTSVFCFESNLSVAKKNNPQLYIPSRISPKSKKIKKLFFEKLRDSEAQNFIFSKLIFGMPFPSLRKIRYKVRYFKKLLVNK